MTLPMLLLFTAILDLILWAVIFAIAIHRDPKPRDYSIRTHLGFSLIAATVLSGIAFSTALQLLPSP